nr:MAG TPA: hypothetical protein [Caudoviricetes sp.]
MSVWLRLTSFVPVVVCLIAVNCLYILRRPGLSEFVKS